jgi:hypothetical protein
LRIDEAVFLSIWCRRMTHGVLPHAPAALSELALELELSVWAPWRLLEWGPNGFWSPNQSSPRFFLASDGSRERDEDPFGGT